MKINKIICLSIASLTSLALLGGCDNPTTSSVSSSASQISSEVESSISSSYSSQESIESSLSIESSEKEESSSSVVNLHEIKVTIPEGNTVELSKTSAEKGEIITFEIIFAEHKIADEVKMNDTLLTPVDGIYSFTMPDSEVNLVITVKDDIISQTLTAPADLNVVHSFEDAENWMITFASVSNATKYYLKVENKDGGIVVDEKQFVSGDKITALTEDGDYVVKVKASAENKVADYVEYLDSEYATFDYKVEHYVDKDINGVKFTVAVEQGKPFGQAKLVYTDGAIFTGTLTEDFQRAEGKHVFPNNMYYEGKFANDTYEDTNGFFSWSTTGDYRDGNSYRGVFKNGTTDGQIGRIETIAFHNNGNGLQYFEGTIQGMAEPKIGSTGKGKINFGAQYYEGDIFIKSSWTPERVGQGQNVWTGIENSGWMSGNTNVSADLLNTKHFDRYIGGFDTINHGWFYGKGVMYILNEDNTPYGYIAGTWDGANLVGAWTDFNPETDLLESYRQALNITRDF